jgi:hypothetical protein
LVINGLNSSLQHEYSPDICEQLAGHREQLKKLRTNFRKAKAQVDEKHRDINALLLQGHVGSLQHLSLRLITRTIREHLQNAMTRISEATVAFEYAKSAATLPWQKALDWTAQVNDWEWIHAYTPTSEVWQALEGACRQATATSASSSRQLVLSKLRRPS